MHSRTVIMYLTIFIITGISILSAITLYENVKNLVEEERGRKAMYLSVSVAKLIEQDLNSFKELASKESYVDGSYNQAYYDRMQSVFHDIQKKTGVKFLYCGKRISENEMVYLFDGEEPGSELFSPIGSKDNLDAIEMMLFQKKTSVFSNIVQDETWGKLLTGLTPIFDPETGTIIAFVGVDVSLDQISDTLNYIRSFILINFLIIIVATSLIVYRLLRMTASLTDRDYLTGLYNKSYQENFLKHLIKKANSNTEFFLLMIDLDDFKEINDKHGHLFGDIILKKVSRTLENYTRTLDKCSRYGGDEFVVILPEATLDYAILVSEWLLNGISSLNKTDSTIHDPISISIGIAQWQPGMTINELLSNADKALYTSKRTGKGKYTLWI